MQIIKKLKKLISTTKNPMIENSEVNTNHIEVGPYTTLEIEKLYYELMENNFYDSNYNLEEWKHEPYELMANIFLEVFSPNIQKDSRILDVGCGVGFLIESLNEKGLNASGVEFSEQIFDRISNVTKPHVNLLNEKSFYEDFGLHDYDLITSLEVFEHLPLRLIKKNLLKLFNEHDGWVFLTIPSIGNDPYSGRLVYYESLPNRIKDMSQNSLFTYLGMLNGKPGGGHITLASYRWWTDFFFLHNWVRDFEKEIKLSHYNKILLANKWCPFILKKFRADEVKFAGGWLPVSHTSEESELKGYWNLSNAEILFVCNRKKLFFEFQTQGPNSNQFPLYITFRLWELKEELSGKIIYKLYKTITKEINYSSTNSYTLLIEFESHEVSGKYFKLELNTPMFLIHDFVLGRDTWVGFMFKNCVFK